MPSCTHSCWFAILHYSSHLSFFQVDENRGRGSMDHTDPTHGTNNNQSNNNTEGKQQSAFQIAVSVAHASDNKVCIW